MGVRIAHLRAQAQAPSLLLQLNVLPRASHSNRGDYAKVDLTCMRRRRGAGIHAARGCTGPRRSDEVRADERRRCGVCRRRSAACRSPTICCYMMHSLSSLAVERLGAGSRGRRPQGPGAGPAGHRRLQGAAGGVGGETPGRGDHRSPRGAVPAPDGRMSPLVAAAPADQEAPADGEPAAGEAAAGGCRW